MTESDLNASFFFANIKIVASACRSRTWGSAAGARAQVIDTQRLTRARTKRPEATPRKASP